MSPLKGQKPLLPAYRNELRTLGDHLRKWRVDQGLLQKEVAQRLAVDDTTVTNWELNRFAPDLRRMPEVIRFLGYLPDLDGSSPGQRLRTARRSLGLSITEVARAAGVDPGTVARCEKGSAVSRRRILERIKTFFDSFSS